MIYNMQRTWSNQTMNIRYDIKFLQANQHMELLLDLQFF